MCYERRQSEPGQEDNVKPTMNHARNATHPALGRLLMFSCICAMTALCGCQRAREAEDQPTDPNPAERVARASAALTGSEVPPSRARVEEEQRTASGQDQTSPARAESLPARGARGRPAGAPREGAGSLYPRPEEVPLAPMGEEIGPSPLTKAPGYHPPDDPEADAVRAGRRKAAVIDTPFTGGENSPEELAQDVLDALRTRDFNALQRLRVNPDEFAEIMWPEFPQSRPLCNNRVDDVFFFLDRTCHSGITLALSTWGGQDLRLLGITYEIGRAPYTNFTLYHGVNIHVLEPDGREAVIRSVRSLAERKGVWKIYSFKDKE
jgi:hypothetical protein